MCSWDTSDADIDALVHDVRDVVTNSGAAAS
jgi:hypothetical protein